MIGILQHHLERVLHVALEGLEPGGGNGTVDNTVVARKSDLHHVADSKAVLLGLIRHQLLGSAADGEDARLRGVDDGSEVLDAEHAEVGDAEAAALVLLGSELTSTSAGGKILDVVRDIRQTAGLGTGHDRGDQTVGSGNSDRDIGVVVSVQKTL